jgi:hypothetical protein
MSRYTWRMHFRRRRFALVLSVTAAVGALLLDACVGDDPTLRDGTPAADGGGPTADAPSGIDSSPAADSSPADGAVDGADAAPAAPRFVFVTSKSLTLSVGINQFDDECRSVAQISQKPDIRAKKFVAWASTTSASAKARIGATSFTGTYMLVDGTPIATSGADLLSGTLLAPINRDESGLLRASASVWTGTTPTGDLDPALNCSDWTDNTKTATQGALAEKNGRWSKSGAPTFCGTVGLDTPIYCFEVP